MRNKTSKANIHDTVNSFLLGFLWARGHDLSSQRLRRGQDVRLYDIWLGKYGNRGVVILRRLTLEKVLEFASDLERHLPRTGGHHPPSGRDQPPCACCRAIQDEKADRL